MTLWTAEPYDDESSRDTIEAGKRADRLVSDRNPLVVEPMSIQDIQVLETMDYGKTTCTRNAEG